MSRNAGENVHPYIRESLDLIHGYDGSIPLQHILNKRFRSGRKYGSRDRRWIRHLCYSWFRLGFSFPQLNPIDRMVVAAIVFRHNNDPFQARVLGRFAALADAVLDSWSLSQRLTSMAGHWNTEAGSHLGDLPEFAKGLDRLAYENAFLTQPYLWIRVVQGKIDAVTDALNRHEIPFDFFPGESCVLRLSSGADLESSGVIEKGWAEVQDLSSQRTLRCMHASDGQHWLDACAASGGKSLLLMDHFPSLRLTVSDVRETMLDRLDERFKRNGIRTYNRCLHDFSRSPLPDTIGMFDGIIADVPCSGSGTWARTPERLRYFTTHELDAYVALQESITNNLIPSLRIGGVLVYITCSVFEVENGGRVTKLQASGQLELVEEYLLQGSGHGADTLYCALLRRIT